MDIFTPRKRSEIMSRIRGRTRPEISLYVLVRTAVGPRRCIFRNYARLLGTPDVFVPSLSLAFFVDGCFFHGCPVHGHIPHTNSEFWERKILRNMRRDRLYQRSLRREGISVWRFWEHDLKTSASLKGSLRRVQMAVQRQRAEHDCLRA
jgi:DNA mismatch endonuclease (patch repair protein)